MSFWPTCPVPTATPSELQVLYDDRNIIQNQGPLTGDITIQRQFKGPSGEQVSVVNMFPGGGQYDVKVGFSSGPSGPSGGQTASKPVVGGEKTVENGSVGDNKTGGPVQMN